MPGRVEQDGMAGYDRKAGQDEGWSGRTGRTAKGAFGGENVATEDQKVRQCYGLGHFRAHGETGVSLNC